MENLLDKLSIASGLSTKYIIDIVEKSNRNYKKRYAIINGKIRLFYIPSNEIKLIQNLIVDIVLNEIETSCYAHAYVRGRSIKTNVLSHKESKFFYQTDIKSFFPSIQASLIREKLNKFLNYDDNDLDTIIKIVAPFGRLDLGSSSSPIISNIVLKDFDLLLMDKLWKKYPTIVYTRYSDDITISSKTELDHECITEIIEGVAKMYNLKLNYKKTKYTEMKDNIKITGLFLNNDKRITVGTRFKKNLKHNLHLLTNGKLTEYENKQLLGKLAYLQDIEPHYHEQIILKYSDEKYSVYDYLK